MAENNNETDKLLAIKEIIFGEQEKRYDNELAALKKQVEQNEKDNQQAFEKVKKELAETKNSLLTEIKGLESKLLSEVDALQKSKTDRVLLSKLFTDMVNKINDAG
ncbi:MAG: hypothetical protein KI790_17115 [Cyclobacteriaceae bacterium]|nr:hypothetical protein [Cyclobacteriaceae bacterium HetDA_MAG_MS6]